MRFNHWQNWSTTYTSASTIPIPSFFVSAQKRKPLTAHLCHTNCRYMWSQCDSVSYYVCCEFFYRRVKESQVTFIFGIFNRTCVWMTCCVGRVQAHLYQDLWRRKRIAVCFLLFHRILLSKEFRFKSQLILQPKRQRITCATISVAVRQSQVGA